MHAMLVHVCVHAMPVHVCMHVMRLCQIHRGVAASAGLDPACEPLTPSLMSSLPLAAPALALAERLLGPGFRLHNAGLSLVSAPPTTATTVRKSGSNPPRPLPPLPPVPCPSPLAPLAAPCPLPPLQASPPCPPCKLALMRHTPEDSSL